MGLETDRKMTVLDRKMGQNTCRVKMNTVLWREIPIRSQRRIRIENTLKNMYLDIFLLILHFDEVGVQFRNGAEIGPNGPNKFPSPSIVLSKLSFMHGCCL